MKKHFVYLEYFNGKIKNRLKFFWFCREKFFFSFYDISIFYFYDILIIFSTKEPKLFEKKIYMYISLTHSLTNIICLFK
jgi:hypothetical protein